MFIIESSGDDAIIVPIACDWGWFLWASILWNWLNHKIRSRCADLLIWALTVKWCNESMSRFYHIFFFTYLIYRYMVCVYVHLLRSSINEGESSSHCCWLFKCFRMNLIKHDAFGLQSHYAAIGSSAYWQKFSCQTWISCSQCTENRV